MKQILLLFAVIFTALVCQSQKISGKLNFQQGQDLGVIMEVKTTISQEAMGQAIDFNIDGIATHSYKVTNATDDNSTLRHEVKRIQFNFEGMGQKRPFDSNNEKDMEGPMGKPVRETLNKTFDMILDPTGKVMLVQPEKMEPVQMDDRMKLIAGMLKDLLDVVQPPQKGSNSFFKVLPDYKVGKGDTWKESYQTEAGRFDNEYTLSDITDSTLTIDMAGTSVTTTKMEIMTGMEITTTLNNKITGKIILDKVTGIIRQRSSTTESTGTTEGMGGATPITSRNTTTILVSGN
jgi:hypothetical protein